MSVDAEPIKVVPHGGNVNFAGLSRSVDGETELQCHKIHNSTKSHDSEMEEI